MAGLRLTPEDSPDIVPPRPSAAAAEMVSDDDRSVAADSWSIKSDYGSTLDDDQRHAEAAEVLSATGTAGGGSGDSYDKDVADSTDISLAEDLASFEEGCRVDEKWFGAEVMDCLVEWIKVLCSHRDLASWTVLEVGTGNGKLLQQLAKQGFSDLTGIDYSEEAIELARSVAIQDGFPHINFLVDDVVETKVDRTFLLILDVGTLDGLGLHPDGPVKRMMYWESVARLVAHDGILIITTCGTTKDELLQEVEQFNQRKVASSDGPLSNGAAAFQYLDHVQNYPSSSSGGSAELPPLTAVAFAHKAQLEPS